MSIEAMKQALEALETTQTLMRLSDPQYVREYNAITSLRQAIAVAEQHTEAAVAEQHKKQEPVMGVEVKRIASGGFVGNVWWIHENLQEGVFHLYTHPQPKREWVGLTDEQIHIRYKAMRGDKSPRYIEIYRDCENAHGIKGK